MPRIRSASAGISAPKAKPSWWLFAAKFNAEWVDRAPTLQDYSHAIAVREAVSEGMQIAERKGIEVSVAEAMQKAESMLAFSRLSPEPPPIEDPWETESMRVPAPEGFALVIAEREPQ